MSLWFCLLCLSIEPCELIHTYTHIQRAAVYCACVCRGVGNATTDTQLFLRCIFVYAFSLSRFTLALACSRALVRLLAFFADCVAGVATQ